MACSINGRRRAPLRSKVRDAAETPELARMQPGAREPVAGGRPQIATPRPDYR
jgi:hypothetical protein